MPPLPPSHRLTEPSEATMRAPRPFLSSIYDSERECSRRAPDCLLGPRPAQSRRSPGDTPRPRASPVCAAGDAATALSARRAVAAAARETTGRRCPASSSRGAHLDLRSALVGCALLGPGRALRCADGKPALGGTAR